ncbi:MAG TPA: DUF6311 domain-containing protein [Stellaceae bacterium]|nr:DUF6311 domain-containing protein [Stellaceae bacterium]
MTGVTRVASRRDELARRVGRIALAELPAWQLLGLAAVVGLCCDASLFDCNFITGRDDFWRFPMGVDMQTVLGSYFYYVQSPWRFPLFYVASLGIPTGTNIIFTDPVPIIALAGKLLRNVTCVTVNPYGVFLFLCFMLPGVAMSRVLIAARMRYALATMIAAIFADTMPALLWRWGDIALEAQFLLIGALALYLFSLRRSTWRGLAMVWAGYLALAYLTNIYLFAMVGSIWLSALVQRRLDRKVTTGRAIAIGFGTILPIVMLIAIGGQFGAGGGLPFARYGYYSMNLLSPFAPQLSGVFPRLGGVIDATGGQYEGYNYLGAGLLLASLLLLPAEFGWMRQNAKRHAALLTAFAALAAFAITNRVFFGHRLLLDLPIPHDFSAVLGIFRSSGRFFWPIGYTQVAIVIVLGFRRPRPLMVSFLLAAALLQLLDIQPLRAHIITSVAAAPSRAPLNARQVANLVAGARRLEIVPSFQCSSRERQFSANMQLMLAAARANVPTNTVYLARQSYGLDWGDVLRSPSDYARLLDARRARYCRHEREELWHDSRPGDVVVLLSDAPGREQLAPKVGCAPLSWARYCKTPGK